MKTLLQGIAMAAAVTATLVLTYAEYTWAVYGIAMWHRDGSTP